MKQFSSISSRKALAGLACSAMLVASPVAFAQFIPTGAGPFDYDDTANWTGGTINNQFLANPTATQTVFFDSNLTLSGTMSINNTTTFNRIFVGGGANRTVTLAGTGIGLGSSTTNINRVIFGSTTNGEQLNIDLGGNRTFTVGSNRTLEFVNVVSGAGSFTKSGTGTVRLSGTANTYTGTTQVGGASSSAGVLEVVSVADSLAPSSIGAGSSITFGGSFASTLRYVGGTGSTNRAFTIGGSGAIFDASGTGAVSFTPTSVSYASGGNPRTLTLTGSNGGNNSMSAGFADTTGPGPTFGPTSISKTGTGKWILNGTNTYTGATSVGGGTLLINGSTAAGSAFTVDPGATLGGTGTIGGTVTVSGTLAPGASVESLKTGETSFLNGSTFALELDSSAVSGAQADLLVASGNVSLAGTVTLTLTNIAALPTAFSLGTTFSLINYSGSLSGSLFTINGNTVADGGYFTVGLNTWQLDYNATAGGTNFTGDYTGSNFVNIVAAVPEPTTTLLLAGGLTLLTLRRSRRRVA